MLPATSQAVLIGYATSENEPDRRLRARTRMAIDLLRLFDEHYSEIASYLRRRQVDRSTADELAQATFEEAWRSRATFNEARGTPRAWLFGIAANLVGRHFRDERRRLRAYARAASRCRDARGDTEAAIDRLDAKALQGPLADGLARLSLPQLEILTLYCWGELSYAEIAQARGIPIGTVKSRMNHARRIMSDHLASYEATHERS